uniref:Exonuclease domain-containing protein n=1 Tax=Panagrellus redivivus TaxID=6233 RepID=A0A7E4UXH7_PANRE
MKYTEKREMLSRLGCFSSVRCPAKTCQRPYCPFRHGALIENDPSPQPADPIPSSSYTQITQQGTTNVQSDYNGYYTAASDPYAPSSSTYDPYNPFSAQYNYTTPSYDAYAPTSSNAPYSAYAPVSYTAEAALPGGFDPNDDAEPGKRMPESPERATKRARRKSNEYEDSGKPVVPPEIGNDEILRNAGTSMKARRKITETKPKPIGPAASNKTVVLNEYVKNISDIDRQLEELKQQRMNLAQKKDPPKPTIDVDALFECEPDEPTPKKICQRTSSSRDSATSAKPSSSRRVPSPPKPLPATVKKSLSDDDVEIIFEKPAPKGSRVAHTPAANIKIPAPLKRKPNLREQVEARQKIIEAARAKEKEKEKEKAKQEVQTDLNSMGFGKNQKRVAHVPASTSKPQFGANRPAFLPKTTVTKLPTSSTNSSSSRGNPIDPTNRKLSINLRHKILDKLVTEFAAFMPRADAIRAAEAEEHELMKRCATQKGYMASVTGVLKRVRDMATLKRTGKDPAKKSSVSHDSVMVGRHAGDITVGLKRNTKTNAQRVDEFTEDELYEALFDKYIMTDEQLEANGYPLWVDEFAKTVVSIKANELDKDRNPYVEENDPRRRCCRCGQSYRIALHPDETVEDADCEFHWGKFWKKRVQGAIVGRYTCCDTGEDSTGCCYSKSHVTQMMPKSVFKEFVETPPPRGPTDPRSRKVIALDCEMVYTEHGSAVARLSVVNYKGTEILDLLIKPPGRLLDTNYRFSGLKPEDVLNAKLNLAEAQQRLFQLVNRDSILIGHSLESDLKAMRIVHKNVIDTAVLFPHKMGPPLKRALKNLSAEILMEIIQEDVSGHDSSEDARIALKLVLHKLKTD